MFITTNLEEKYPSLRSTWRKRKEGGKEGGKEGKRSEGKEDRPTLFQDLFFLNQHTCFHIILTSELEITISILF